MTLAAKVKEAVALVCPITGVSIGRSDDKETWKIHFAEDATAQQRADAQAAVEDFDLQSWMDAEAAAISRAAIDDAECAAAKQDNQERAFLNMTPAELDTWIDNNIAAAGTLAVLRTNTATALRVLGRLAQNAARGRRLR